MNIDNLAINQTLPAITCDYESLRQWALGITDKYKDLVVQEDDLKAIKSDMAELNKAKGALDRARIDTVKAVSAPIREFEENIKSITKLFAETYDGLAVQVKKFEEAEKARKRNEIMSIIAAEASYAGIDSDTIPFNDKWLNKTTTIKSIREDIKGIIQAIKERERVYNVAPAEIPPFAAPGNTLPIYDPSQGKVIPPVEQDDNQSIKEPERDISAESIARMEAQVAAQPPRNETCWTMRFTYPNDKAEAVREIFRECQFMRIVRKLDAIGIKAKIEKEER